MTTYRDLSTLAAGTKLIFIGYVGINYHPENGTFDFMIPNGTVMVIAENRMFEPDELLVLRADSAIFAKMVQNWNPNGTVNLGPDGSGEVGLDEIAPVDVK